MKRFISGLAMAALALCSSLTGGAQEAHARQATLIAGGDIEWSRAVKPADAFLFPARQEEGGWIPVPYLNLPERRSYLEDTLGIKLETEESHHVRAIRYNIKFSSSAEEGRYPFKRIAPVLESADITFANLETPLSNRARHTGAFRTPTSFAEAIREAGIDVVSVANNHALDAEEQGLLDTIENLWRTGVGSVGGGRNLEDARRPFIVERNGIKVAFLGYTQFVNEGRAKAFALPNRSGVVALDPFIIKEDIRRVRNQVDYVVLSFHWSIENTQETHPDSRKFAREMLDAGADIILGHHPHMPQGIEVYKGKVVFYSMGNLVFGHSHDYWVDNFLGRLTLTRKGISQVEILPVSGRGEALSQPYLLEGAEARAFLEDIQARSAKLDTKMEIKGNVGVIKVSR